MWSKLPTDISRPVGWLMSILSLSLLVECVLPECPDGCKCNYRRRTVSCESLDRIPLGIPNDTVALSMKNGNVSTLGPNMIDHLAHLRKVQFDGVRIQHIDQGVFTNPCTNLSQIQITNSSSLSSGVSWRNLLCSINSTVGIKLHFSQLFESELITLNVDTFHCLRSQNVTFLHVSNNNMVFPDRIFAGLSIQTLMLSNTCVGSGFNADMFKGMTFLGRLDLSNYRFSAFPRFRDNESVFLPNLTYLGLQFIDLLPIISSDAFIELESLETLNITRTHIEVGENCLTNSSTIKDLVLRSVTFNLSPAACSATKCFIFSCIPNLNKLEISNCDSDEYKDILQVAFHEVHKLETLTLQDDNITNLTKGIFRGLYNLKVLDLSYNGIESWSGDVFKGLHLEKLLLKYNKIQTLAEDYFPSTQFLRNLNILDISYNDFYCTCDLYWFSTILRRLRCLTNLNDTLCKHPSKYKDKEITLYRPQSNNECTWNFSSGYLLIVYSSSAVVVIVGTVAVCYKYKWHLRHLLFRMQPNVNQYESVHDDVEPTEYDAFVSYNKSDLRWLKYEFLPYVEGKLNLRLCLHDRDWLAGIDIVDNIANSIVKSRKVILIISNAFMRSQWCQMELTMAQHHLFQQDRNSLILILLETIHDFNITPRLALQMKTKTYIEWTRDPAGRTLFHKQVKRAVESSETSIRMQM